MLFGRSVISSLFAIGLLTAFLGYFHTRILPSDRKLYQKLIQQTAALRSRKALERHPASQVREGIQKDIWTSEEAERTHYKMVSHHSTLSVKQNKENIEATEELEDLSCLLQGPLIYASKGVYHYPSYEFSLNQVRGSHELGQFEAGEAHWKSIPGKEDKPLLKLDRGVLLKTIQNDTPLSIQSLEAICPVSSQKTLSFLHKEKMEFFHQVKILIATELKAFGGSAIYEAGSLTLYPEIPKTLCLLHYLNSQIQAKEILFDLVSERILCKEAKGSLQIAVADPISFSAKHLAWEKQNGKIKLEEEVHIEQLNQCTIQANRADIALQDKNKPSLIEISGNVHLFSPSIQNKDSFAIADTIAFSPIRQTMTLSAIAPNRVLFWQEGVSLSAPEIFIEKDPLTGEEYIQGKGDVRFTFDMQEQNIIDQFISQYLRYL